MIDQNAAVPNDPASQFEQFKQRLAVQWQIPLPSAGGQQVSGPAMTGTTQADRFQQAAGRGTAPLTAGGLLTAGSNAMSLMGGLGAVTTGLGSMAELGGGYAPGSFGGIQNIPGYAAIPPERRRLIGNLVDYHNAIAAAQNGQAYGGGGYGAVGAGGQVRGGGTGSVGGGLMAGGPR